MEKVAIIGAFRTAIGKLGGSLASVSATELSSIALKQSMAQSKVAPSDIEEVIIGQVIQAGAGPNPTRRAALLAGIPETVPSYTVNMVCASGMKAVELGALLIASGQRQIVAVGGMENMSMAPYLLEHARSGYRLGNGELVDAVLRDALVDPAAGCHMGMTAEKLAEWYAVSRREQDAYAADSQLKACRAMQSGAFEAETVPVPVPQRRGSPMVFDRDEFPRPDTTADTLSTLKPAFTRDETVTAGNSSGINDGAATMLLVSETEARRRGLRPMARILATASTALEPERMGLGPVSATRDALARAGLNLQDIDVVELNEAFAVQCIAVMRELHLSPDVVNLNGGAIALGHPVGATGARILVTLLHLMHGRGAKRGLATLCVGGGQGMATVVERLEV